MTRRRPVHEPRQGLLFADAAAGPLPLHTGLPPAGAEPAPGDPPDRGEPPPAAQVRPRSAGDREIALGEQRVAYVLRRARRRSIGFIVGADGLTVHAPAWVPLRDVESALRGKAGWILRKLGEQQDRARRRVQDRIDWRDGTTIPFLGERLVVVIDPGAAAVEGGAMLDTGATALPDSLRLRLHVDMAPGAEPAQLRERVQAWLQRQARRVFEERCAIYAERLGVRMTRLALSSARTRWGSASTNGTIRLHWRLIHFGLPTIDYVVAHELAHLREMNHGPRFWAVVRSVVPDYEHARRTLRSDMLPPFD